MSSSLGGPFASLLDQFKTGIGSWLVGTFLSTLLVGMLLQQTFRYFRLYPNDPRYMKIWVITAVILQMLTTAMVMHVAYYYLVSNYLDLTVWTRGDVWSAPAVPIVGSINNLVFFARRVYMIGRRYSLVVLSAMVMVLASCGFFIARSVQGYTQPDIVASVSTGGWIINVASVLLLLGDVQLTGILVYVLHKNRGSIRRTNSMVDILIAYAISSGSLICVINIVSLILSIVFPHVPIFSAASLVSQAVYTNSFIVALNTRQFVQSRGELDNTNIDTVIVLGEKPGSSGNASAQVSLPLTSMVFAEGPSRSQLDGTVLEASHSDESLRHPGKEFSECDLEKNAEPVAPYV
ncbi:hypothetical protein ONZ51_g2824 [Trametes cubensis]|uniref:DUF6534 domain-containing protein n=1 Tax=Trametes cubensis TaxID=1111947 RepID=A0AAD7U1J4_9APHY|nr:hypothetical protein ONZ51_g2824 [Trametes cubensis]